jgi:hypothetical protein
MIDVLNLALPYFGLIFIGFACGRAKGLPETGLALAVLGAKAAAPNALAGPPRRPPRRRQSLAHGEAPKRSE